MSVKSLFSKTEPSLHALLIRTTQAPDQREHRERLLAFRATLRLLSAKITGAGRREFPTPAHWAVIVCGLSDMMRDRNCPSEIQGEIDMALREACSRMKMLVHGPDQGAANGRPIAYAKKLLAAGPPARRGRKADAHPLLKQANSLRERGVRPHFEIFGTWQARTVKSPLAPAGAAMISGIASSTATDLESDRFTETALKQMARGLVNHTCFLNHRYNWPSDVLGRVTSAHISKRGADSVLNVEVAVAMENPAAKQTYDIIKGGSGAKPGFSIGVLVLDTRQTNETHMGRKVMEITDILPLEVSAVGIPANTLSWVEAAKAGLKGRPPHSRSPRSKLDQLLDTPLPTRTKPTYSL